VENGPCLYYAGASTSKTITKASFNKKIKGMNKGKAITASPEKWIKTQNPAYTW
jgi:hypothetical protein